MYTIRPLNWFKNPAGYRESEFVIDGKWTAVEDKDGKVTVVFESEGCGDMYQKIVHDYDEAEAYAQRKHEERLRNYLTFQKEPKHEERYESTYGCSEGACQTPSGVKRTKVSPS